jgi:hypothetical protein
VYNTTLAADGSLWIAGHWELFNVESRKGRTLRRILIYDPEVTSITDAFVSCQVVFEANDGTLFVGTEGAGLVRVGNGQKDITYFPFHDLTERGTVGSTVFAIAAGDDGDLWLGTDRGLERFRRQSKVFDRTVDLGVVYSILIDDDGALWMGTGRGIASYSPQDGRLRTYDGSDGIRSAEFNRRAAQRLASGEFVFGGLEGVTSFNPTQIQDNPHVPPVEILRVTTSNRDTTKTRNVLGLRNLSVSYNEYQVSFEYAVMGHTAPEGNRYEYKLDGFEERWTDGAGSRRASYTNLRPGTYTFRVRGSNNDGVWNTDGDSLELTVIPLFYQTWLFKLLMVGLVCLAAYMTYRYRVARLLEMARMRMRIAADLHDDIGSRLSGIALMSDVVADTADLAETERAQLTRISRGTREMVDTLRDIVWFVHPDNETSEELLRKMEEVAATLLRTTSFVIHCDDRSVFDRLDLQSRRNLFLIYKEAIANIARHARATMVAITIRHTRDHILVIEDNGVGFDQSEAGTKENARRGNGLRNIVRRAVQIGGRADIESSIGSGTRISVSLGDL